MLNNMIASFTASNQIGEAMKEKNAKNIAEAKAKKSPRRPRSNNDDDVELNLE